MGAAFGKVLECEQGGVVAVGDVGIPSLLGALWCGPPQATSALVVWAINPQCVGQEVICVGGWSEQHSMRCRLCWGHGTQFVVTCFELREGLQ